MSSMDMEKIKHYNSEIRRMTVTQLFNMDFILPEEQRLSDSDKVAQIVEYQENFYKQQGHCNFLGVINIHHCIEEQNDYLVDGQHRVAALRKLLASKITNIHIMIEYVTVATRKELKENYELLNQNTPLPKFPEAVDKNIPEKAFRHFEGMYPQIWSSSYHPQRPNLNKNHFQEALAFLTDKLSLTSSQTLINLVNTRNQTISQWDWTQYPNKRSPTMIKKCRKAGFFLGMDPHISEPYSYKWVKDIVREKTGNVLSDQSRQFRKTIPKRIKNQVWNHYIGKDKGIALCCVCRQKEIEKDEFTCGHVKSDNDGGTLKISNLRPICTACNTSMNSTHMKTYMNEFYPQNIMYLDNPSQIPAPTAHESSFLKNIQKKILKL